MSGINVKVTDQAVASMRNMRNELEDISNQLKAEIRKLDDAFEENKAGLGSHTDDIRKLLDELMEAADEADGPVKLLRRRLMQSAVLREKSINDSPYGRSR